MFILRSVDIGDIDDLYELSQLVQFINLPPNKALIESKVLSSIESFVQPHLDLSKNYYLFVLENLNEGKVVGACMVHAQHGTEEEPHFYLKVGQEKKFSTTINTGFIHGTLKLGMDTNGPTEIGGLVLHPSLRGHPDKLGKQLSFVRFLYMGINPDRFKEKIHAELMPPLDAKGNSPLWEAIGRKFMNMDYQDADKLSLTNKEFILNLFPRGTIYETLLPLNARNAIGKVGNDTLPVKSMLEKIGFKYTQEVDPFDGGPHYRAKLKDISLVKNLVKGRVEHKKVLDPKQTRDFLVTTNDGKNFFGAAKMPLELKNENKNTISFYTSNETFYAKLLKGSKDIYAIPL